jgi:hypothetical protein
VPAPDGQFSPFDKKSADVTVRAHSLAIPRFLQTLITKTPIASSMPEPESLDLWGIAKRHGLVHAFCNGLSNSKCNENEPTQIEIRASAYEVEADGGFAAVFCFANVWAPTFIKRLLRTALRRSSEGREGSGPRIIPITFRLI